MLFVAQLVEQSLPKPEVRGWNPAIGKIYMHHQLYWKDENKEKRGREWPILPECNSKDAADEGRHCCLKKASVLGFCSVSQPFRSVAERAAEAWSTLLVLKLSKADTPLSFFYHVKAHSHNVHLTCAGAPDSCVATSVTRFGDLLDFGQFLNAFGNT